MNKLYGIGLGPGDPDLLTIKAKKILGKIDVIAVPYSNEDTESIALKIAVKYIKKNTEIIKLKFPMIKDIDKRNQFRKNNADIIKSKLKNNKNVGFLTLGDPLFYSTFVYLMDYIDKKNIEIIPGITSISSSAGEYKIPLAIGNENLAVFTGINNFNPRILDIFNTIVFMKVSSYANKLHEIIKNNNWQDYFYMIASSSMEKQTKSNDFNQLLDKIDYLTTVIIRKI